MDDKGWTVLLIKQKAKGNAVGNYGPITCLPIMRKVLTPVSVNIVIVIVTDIT